jgi:transposase
MVGMSSYSEDLRTRIVAAVEDGMPKTEAARLFGVSRSSVSRSSLKRYCTLTANEELLAPRKGGGRPRRRTPPSRGCSKRT